MKQLALRLLPDGLLQPLKKMHYARVLREASEDDEADLKIVRFLIGKGDLVADIGANMGRYTKFFSQATGESGCVLSVEPIPLTFDILQSNVKRLRLGNVRLCNCAVSDTVGEAVMEIPRYKAGGENFYQSRIVDKLSSADSLRRVPVVLKTIDTLFMDSAKPVAFIKLDVEGNELRALRGAQGVIEKYRPAWLVEISGNPNDSASQAFEVFKLLGGKGYEAYWFDGKALRKRTTGDMSVNYFFLMPRHSAHLERISDFSSCDSQQTKKIRLAIVVDVLDYITGGAERQIYEFLRRVDKERFDVTFVVIHARQLPEEIHKLGIAIKPLNMKRIYDLKGIQEGIKLIQFLKQERTDCVMTYHFSADIWGTLCAHYAGVPVIISNRRDIGFWRKPIHRIAYRFINKWVTMIAGNSKAVVAMVQQEEGVSDEDEKVKLFYNGVDVEKFKINSGFHKPNLEYRRWGIAGDALIIGCIGNLKPVKGQNYLVQAAVEVTRRIPKAHFVFIGEDEWDGTMEAHVKELGLEKNVSLLGKKNDVVQLLVGMDMCVLPSLSEGFSNALLEYMAASKPVIATAVGGNIEIVEHEKNGLLVPPKDAQALAQATTRLLEDKELAERLGQAARKTVEENFDIKKKIREFENFLEETYNSKLQISNSKKSKSKFQTSKFKQ